MRFLADMGVAQGVVAWLREQEHDAVHLRAEGLQKLPDDQVFLKAEAERRVILTFDLDFGELAAQARQGAVGIILFRLKNARTVHVVERLKRVLPLVTEALDSGSLILIEEARFRVRTLPIRSMN